MGQSMKMVQRIACGTLSEGAENTHTQLSKPPLKALAISALQPLAAGFSGDEVQYNMILVHDLFVHRRFFMISYAVFFLIVGFFISYFFNKLVEKRTRRYQRFGVGRPSKLS